MVLNAGTGSGIGIDTAVADEEEEEDESCWLETLRTAATAPNAPDPRLEEEEEWRAEVLAECVNGVTRCGAPAALAPALALALPRMAGGTLRA